MAAVNAEQMSPVATGGEPSRADLVIPSGREMLLAFLGLIAVAATALGHYVANGGFFLDDWADAAGTLYTPGGHTLGNVFTYFSNLFEYRPVLIAFTPVKYSILGANITLNLAWTVLFGVFVALLVYSILRTIRIPWCHAWLIAALTLLYPWYDSLRFWPSANPPLLGIFFAFAGIQVALVGVARRSWRWHMGALFLYLLSILSYELTAPVILAAGFLYTTRIGFRASRWRWAADAVTVAVGLLWVGTHTTRTVAGLSADFHHLREIIEGGKDIFVWTFYPLGATPRTGLVLAAVGVVFAFGSSVYFLRRQRGDEPKEGWGLREWLLLGAAGLVVAVLGWVMLIPADPYYTPSIYAATNRVNALSGFGLVISAYAVVGIGVSAAASLWRPLWRWATPVTIGLMLLLGAAWMHVLERHAGAWEAAYRAERLGLDQIKRQYPRLPPGSTVFTAGYPSYQALGVPIFAFSWDLTGAVQNEYETNDVSASPVLPGTELECRADGIGLRGTAAPETFGAYGSVKLLDLSTGFHAEPRNRRQCEGLAPRFVPGPEYVQYEY